MLSIFLNLHQIIFFNFCLNSLRFSFSLLMLLPSVFSSLCSAELATTSFARISADFTCLISFSIIVSFSLASTTANLERGAERCLLVDAKVEARGENSKFKWVINKNNNKKMRKKMKKKKRNKETNNKNNTSIAITIFLRW